MRFVIVAFESLQTASRDSRHLVYSQHKALPTQDRQTPCRQRHPMFCWRRIKAVQHLHDSTAMLHRWPTTTDHYAESARKPFPPSASLIKSTIHTRKSQAEQWFLISIVKLKSCAMSDKSIAFPPENYPNYLLITNAHDVSFFESILENYLISIAFVWVALHDPPWTPVLVEIFYYCCPIWSFPNRLGNVLLAYGSDFGCSYDLWWFFLGNVRNTQPEL